VSSIGLKKRLLMVCAGALGASAVAGYSFPANGRNGDTDRLLGKNRLKWEQDVILPQSRNSGALCRKDQAPLRASFVREVRSVGGWCLMTVSLEVVSLKAEERAVWKELSNIRKIVTGNTHELHDYRHKSCVFNPSPICSHTPTCPNI
jgi:hypothetical protein